nr:histidine kinase [Tessaracoccus sp. OS52]
MRTEAIDRRRPPWWRTALLMPLGLLGTLISVVYSPAGWEMTDSNAESGSALLLAFAGMLLALVGSIALAWRHRAPVWFAVVAALLPLAIPVGNTFAYITVGSLIGRRRGPGVWAVTALTILTTTWVVVADAMAQPLAASFVKKILTGAQADPSQAVDVAVGPVIVMAVVGLGASIGVGLLLRARRLARLAEATARAERRVSSVLGDEVARREERERIAREVHDALGHRLSLLGLHAGAIEANSEGDERLRTSASLVRNSAEGAMDDLRSLLGMLRSPTADQPELPLTLLPRVVEESFGAGQQLSSSVFIQEAAHADPALSRAVYRIVQELLNNARKHAPDARTVLSVIGGPDTGITIDARNPVRPPAAAGPSAPGSRRGLSGIAERAELLGGSVRYGLDEGGTVFRVEVRLPWLYGGAGRAGTQVVSGRS